LTKDRRQASTQHILDKDSKTSSLLRQHVETLSRRDKRRALTRRILLSNSNKHKLGSSSINNISKSNKKYVATLLKH